MNKRAPRAWCLVLMVACSMLLLDVYATDTNTNTSPLLAAIAELAAAGSENAAQVWHYQYPRDYHPHPDQAMELWQILGEFSSAGGETYLADIQFARFQFTAPHDATAAAPSSSASAPSNTAAQTSSHWRFNQVTAVAVNLVEQNRGQSWVETGLARVALGLGSAEASGHIQVNQHRFVIAAGNSPVAPCQLELELKILTVAMPLQIKLAAEHCPPAGNGPDTSRSVMHGYSMPLSVLSAQLGDQALSAGQAWLLHNWGDLPATQSPVVLDRFYVLLENKTLLQIIRSRRGDGSGQPVLTAVLHQQRQRRGLHYRDIAIQDLAQWVSEHSGKRFSARWKISWPGYTAELSPLIAEQERSVFGQTRWAGAVKAIIETEGQVAQLSGFVDLSPLPGGFGDE